MKKKEGEEIEEEGEEGDEEGEGDAEKKHQEVVGKEEEKSQMKDKNLNKNEGNKSICVTHPFVIYSTNYGGS